MLSLLRTIKGLKCRDLYFCERAPAEPDGEDVQFFLQSSAPLEGASPFFTSMLDLELDEVRLAAGIGKNASYKIRRAKERDRVDVAIVDAPSASELETFQGFYDAFSRWRGVPRCSRERLRALAAGGGLTVSFSRVGEGDGPWLSAHAYVCDGVRARLLYSARNVALIEEQGALIGRANRYMHWRTILHFKARGCRLYDFGGIGKGPEGKAIAEFKLEFGGREALEYNLLRGVSARGKAAVALYRLKSRLRARA